MNKKIVQHLYHCHLSEEGQDPPPQFEALLDSSEVQAPSPQRVASPGDDDDGDDGDDDDDGNDDDDDNVNDQPLAPSGSSSSPPVHQPLCKLR